MDGHPHPTDVELVDQFQKASSPATAQVVFRQLVERYQERIYVLARRFTEHHDEADDIVQEAFIRAYEALPRFQGASSFYTWIYRIASNVALNYLRAKKLRRFVGIDTVINEPESDSDPVEDTDRKFRAEKIQSAIDNLPPKQQLVFTLRYMEGLSYEEISEITKTSVGALKANYFHALQKVGQELKRTMGTGER